MILERLSASGIDTSPYYKPNGKFNLWDAGDELQMPNCTMYAYLRSFEICNATAPFPIAKSGLGFGNAKSWYSQSPLKKGSKLKSFSIAVFNGVYGHVAIVERRIDDTHALISESQYDDDKSLRNYKYWQKREVELVVGKATLSGVGELLGFLYLPIEDIRTLRDTTKEQISINEEFVNVRGLPNGEVARKGCYAPMGIYNVQDIKNDGEYNWYQLDKACWVRDGEWLAYYPIEENELQRLKAENKELKKENEILLNIIHDIHNMTGV